MIILIVTITILCNNHNNKQTARAGALADVARAARDLDAVHAGERGRCLLLRST